MKLKDTQKLILIILAVLIASGILLVIALKKGNEVANNNLVSSVDPEIARSMTYTPVASGDEIVSGTNSNVHFDAFFLRDINEDGIADAIRGTCQEVGSQDTLYMELNVLTEGYLKDGKISINGQNFYLATSLPKDEQLKDSYIGNNVKFLELNQINNGTQKMIMGIVRSGDYTYQSRRMEAIGRNIDNYSRSDNEVVLTGTYVNGNGEETQIEKRILLTVDWHGTTTATIKYASEKYNTYSDIDERADEVNGTFTLDFEINTEEIDKELLLQKHYLTGTLPLINGYAPISVSTTSNNVTFAYNSNTRRFGITRLAEVDETTNTITKVVSDSNRDKIVAVYPIAAYESLLGETLTIEIPVSTYYSGYNNPNSEFTNPYKSNVAQDILVAKYRQPIGTVARVNVVVGKLLTKPEKRYIVSKQKPLKIYNGASSQETGDEYEVKWEVVTGTNGESTGLVLKETQNGESQVADRFIKVDSTKDSMENLTSNVGIYFDEVESIIGEEGEIKVYDDETNILLVTFTKNGGLGTQSWDTYTSTRPYRYDYSVKHIRVETSSTNADGVFYVYNVKELDDDYITTNYTKEQFDELKYIQSTLVGYLGDSFINEDVDQARYEAPISVATISLSQSSISTQQTEENDRIVINAEADNRINQSGWKDGNFLVKLPSEILDIEINSISINNANVRITNYEIEEREISGDTVKFIRINTSNLSTAEQSYAITINCNITPDPRIATVNRQIVLYASNEGGADYYYKAADIYDVNNNLNVSEQVNKTSTEISLISPNSLLTNQTMSEFDENATVIVSPGVAELQPVYGNQQIDKQTVKIGVQVKNNYSSTISEVALVGKIPFEGNTTIISQRDLGSTFSTEMTSSGIEVPTELLNLVTVYYSENENPNKDLNDSTNGWKLKENVTNWSQIKSYLIDFGNTIIEQGDEYVFYYTVEIPFGVEINEISYSHHGIYFSLDTDQGKYQTQTEPNKVGVRITDKFNLELTKYQKGKSKLIPGATYRVSELTDQGEIVTSKTAVTNNEGKLEIANLYAEKQYEIREIISPENYELNEDVIIIIGHVNTTTGVITVEKLEGTIKGNIVVEKNEGEDYKAKIQVEDEVLARLKITKTAQETGSYIRGAMFKITGPGMPTTGRTITTNQEGTADISGIKIGETYKIEETKAEGYYLLAPIEFRILNNEGTYSIQIKNDDGTYTTINSGINPYPDNEAIKQITITEENNIPIVNAALTNEEAKKYSLELIKIKKISEDDGTQNNQEIEYLEGATFRLYKDGKVLGSYTTDASGKFTINNLYQYIEGKNISGTYVLKETVSPAGYTAVKDITFRINGTAKYDDNTQDLVYEEVLEDGQTAKQYVVEGNTIKLTVEDNPIFKLIKKDAETNELLPGVKFSIYRVDEAPDGEPARNSKGEIIGTKETINGKEYYTVTTDSRGEITLDLPEGFYKAVEVEADEKYNIIGTTRYFGIGASREPASRLRFETEKTGDTRYYDITATSDGGYLAVGYDYVDYIHTSRSMPE